MNAAEQTGADSIPAAIDTSLVCPTCGARQQPSTECRRCKCDLSLVVACRRQQQALRRIALDHLQAGRNLEALHAARRCYKHAPGEDTARLLAVCFAAAGRFQAAIDVYERTTNR